MLRRSGGSVFCGEETTRSPTTDFARGRLDEAGDQPQRRGLAAARRPEQADQRAVLDRHRNIVDDGQRPVFFRQPAQFDRRHRNPLNQPPTAYDANTGPRREIRVSEPVNTGLRFSMKALRPSS